MESIVRGAATYIMVWFIFRLTGKRTLAQITTFDAVLLLIISETTQASLIDENRSFTNALLLILTMLGIDVVLSGLKQRFPTLERVLDGAPLTIFKHGEFNKLAMGKERIDQEDVLHAARKDHGLDSLDRIKEAVLETTGEISVIRK